MALRLPLVLISGQQRELPAGDTINDATKLLGPFPKSGCYLNGPGSGTTAPPAGALRSYAIVLAGAGTADRIGIEVVTAAAGTTVGLAIHAHDLTTGLPGTLLLDAGTVDSSTTGFKEITISQAVAPGPCWLTSLSLGGAPTLRSVSSALVLPPTFAQSELGNVTIGVARSGQASMPSPFAPAGSTPNCPKVYLRCA